MGQTKRLFEQVRERERASQPCDDYDYQYEQYLKEQPKPNQDEQHRETSHPDQPVQSKP